MKATIANIALGLLLLVAAGSLIFAYSSKSAASVVTGSEYGYATTTAAGHTNIRSTYQAGPCTLGSVIIASSSASGFVIWNATSTTDIASTTIADFDEAAAVGTYTFDIACSRGLSIIAETGFNGYVITTHR